MVARDVVVFRKEFHADPFQSGFDSQHRQEQHLGLEVRWFNSIELVTLYFLVLVLFAFI